MKKMTIWRDGDNLGSKFKDGNKVIGWQDLSKDEQLDFVMMLDRWKNFYEKFIKD